MFSVPNPRQYICTKYAWEQRKLGDLGSVAMNKRVFKEQTSENGEVPFFKIGTFGSEPDSFISRELFEEYKLKYPYPEIGDILISASGSIGRTVVYQGKDEYFQDSNIVWLKHNNHLDNKFLKQFYSIVKWQGLEGSTIKRLYNKNILDTNISIPSPEEQQKIGQYFKKLDETITLHQRKLDKLKQLKQGYLQLLFPQSDEKVPRIRFANFDENWNLCNIKKLAKVFIGLVTSMTENYREEGTLLIRNSDIKSGKFEFADNPIYLDEQFAEKNNTRRLSLGDVITVHTGDIGTSAVIGAKESGAIGFATINTRPNENMLDSNYLSIYFNTTNHKNWATKMSTGDGRSNYNLYDFNRVMIPLPNLIEQKLIGAFLKKFNNIINLEQSKLNELKSLKEALLQKMFI
ncbi:restriction endonuclease subunit S [Lactococcus lactis]|uniref:restriction endonuclease subunit S n=1 Tax=Lactococcus lactis TaxID=1358 RepID=UPI00387797AE